MNVTFACPRCDGSGRVEVASTEDGLDCPHCQQRIMFPPDAFEDGQLRRCLVCPSTDLYVRKAEVEDVRGRCQARRQAQTECVAAMQNIREMSSFLKDMESS